MDYNDQSLLLIQCLEMIFIFGSARVSCACVYFASIGKIAYVVLVVEPYADEAH